MKYTLYIDDERYQTAYNINDLIEEAEEILEDDSKAEVKILDEDEVLVWLPRDRDIEEEDDETFVKRQDEIDRQDRIKETLKNLNL